MPKPQARKPHPDHAPLAAVLEQLVAPACAHEQLPLTADPSGFEPVAPDGDTPSMNAWLRGLAFHRAGDYQLASEAFGRYFGRRPGDLMGAAATEVLKPGPE